MDGSTFDQGWVDEISKIPQVQAIKEKIRRTGKRPTRQEFKEHLKDAQLENSISKVADHYDQHYPVHGYRYTRYPYNSAATPPTCLNHCPPCSEQFNGPRKVAQPDYAKSLTDAKAQKTVTDFRTATTRNLDYVRTQLDKHGDNFLEL